MASWFGPNSAMLLGRALGLMNSSASWKPWMEDGGHLGEAGGPQGEREGQPAGALGMRNMEVWGG